MLIVRGMGIWEGEGKIVTSYIDMYMLYFSCRSAEVCVDGKSFTLQPSMVSIKRYQKTIHGELDIARYGAPDDYRVSQKWRLTHIPLLFTSHFTPPTSPPTPPHPPLHTLR